MRQVTGATEHFSMTGDLRAIYHLLREKARLLAAIVGVAVLAGVVHVARSERIYAATTTLEVEQEQQKLVKTDGRSPGDRTGEEVVKTIEQSLLSPALMLRLVRHPELAGDPAFLRQVKRPASEARLQTALVGKIAVRIRRGTRLIDVTVEDANPAMARNIAQLLVDEFVRATSEERARVSQGAHEFLREESDRLAARLAKSEQALQRYKEQHQAISLEEKQNIIVERLRELNAKVTTAKAERLKLEADGAQFQQLAGSPPGRLLALPSIAGAAEVVDLLRKIGEREAEIATLSRRYKPEHPKYIETGSALAELKVSLDSAILKAADLVGTAAEAAQATEKKLEDALRGQQSLALELSQMAIPYNALAREVESDRALYQSLLARLKEANVAQGVSQYAVRIVVPPVEPELPVKPNKRAILLLSACAGIAVGLTAVLGARAMDSSLRTVDQAERRLALRSIGAIPQRRKTKLGKATRLLTQRPQSAVAEAFRSLRTELFIATQNGGGRSVIFASAIPGEGKSFCAINYAIALAQQGLRTLLIDADLRLPSIESILLATNHAPGLSDLLLGRAHLAEAIQPTDIGNLSVLPAGKRVPNPSDIIGTPRLAILLDQLRGDFDRVVIDTAPVHAVSDTLLIVPHVEAVCLVVRAGGTPAVAVERALQKLREAGAKVAGFVLNALPTRNGGYYYHYHSPGYGGDEVYGASAAPDVRAQGVSPKS